MDLACNEAHLLIVCPRCLVDPEAGYPQRLPRSRFCVSKQLNVSISQLITCYFGDIACCGIYVKQVAARQKRIILAKQLVGEL